MRQAASGTRFPSSTDDVLPGNEHSTDLVMLLMINWSQKNILFIAMEKDRLQEEFSVFPFVLFKLMLV